VAVGFATHAFVLARGNGTRVLHDLAVGAREALRAAALVLVGGGVFAGAAVQARLVSAAVVEIYGNRTKSCKIFETNRK